jgi:hypothetical protein
VQQRWDAEEMPIVLATLRAYPRQEFFSAAIHFRDQLERFDMFGFWVDASMTDLVRNYAPQLASGYLRSRQARNALPLGALSGLQFWVLMASLAVVAGLAAFLVRRPCRRLAGLGFLIAATVIGNACVTGIISRPDPRFQCRVIWLIPFFAGLLLLDEYARRNAKQDAYRDSESF